MFVTIEKNINGELIEKKSKFICNIYYVETKGGKIAAIGCAYDEYSFRDAGFTPVLYASSRMDSEGGENESKS